MKKTVKAAPANGHHGRILVFDRKTDGYRDVPVYIPTKEEASESAGEVCQ